MERGHPYAPTSRPPSRFDGGPDRKLPILWQAWPAAAATVIFRRAVALLSGTPRPRLGKARDFDTGIAIQRRQHLRTDGILRLLQGGAGTTRIAVCHCDRSMIQQVSQHECRYAAGLRAASLLDRFDISILARKRARELVTRVSPGTVAIMRDIRFLYPAPSRVSAGLRKAARRAAQTCCGHTRSGTCRKDPGIHWLTLRRREARDAAARQSSKTSRGEGPYEPFP